MDREYVTSTGKSFDERHIIMYTHQEKEKNLFTRSCTTQK